MAYRERPSSSHEWSREHNRQYLFKFRIMVEEFLSTKKLSLKGDLISIIDDAYKNKKITQNEKDNLHILRMAGNVGSHMDLFNSWKEGI